jgi:hypothetical protein
MAPARCSRRSTILISLRWGRYARNRSGSLETMDALTGCFALFLLFAGWIVVGAVNLFIVSTHPYSDALGILGGITWLLSGPTWAFLFLRWKGKGFRAASERIQEKLLRKTRAHLKNHSVQG